MLDPRTGCPDRPVEPPEREAYADVCCVCREPILLHETYYDFSGDAVHEDCLREYAKRYRTEAES